MQNWKKLTRRCIQRDTLLRHMSSHAKPPATRNSTSSSSSSKRPHEEQHFRPGDCGPISLAATSQPTKTTTPVPQRSDLDPMDLFPFADDKSDDIDVPPELSSERDPTVFETPSVIPSSSGRIIEIDDLDPLEVARLFGSGGNGSSLAFQTSDLMQNSVSPALDRYQSHGSDSQPESFELPPELFNSTVDVHARTWLRDFCAGD
ncbi:hypothetical protein AYO22_03667 [Fonsecaea multimorphosa]|nr:hypothetical protein AYO22_03667 [Fonsecaea multimorphosa]